MNAKASRWPTPGSIHPRLPWSDEWEREVSRAAKKTWFCATRHHPWAKCWHEFLYQRALQVCKSWSAHDACEECGFPCDGGARGHTLVTEHAPDCELGFWPTGVPVSDDGFGRDEPGVLVPGVRLGLSETPVRTQLFN